MKAAGVLLCCAAFVYLLTLGLLAASTSALLFTLLAFSIMALPGIFIGILLFGWDIPRHPESVLFGAAIGIALSGFVALMIGFLFQWSIPVIAITLVTLAVGSLLLARRYGGDPLVDSLRPWTAGDYTVLGTMLLLLLSFVTLPFLRVGHLTPNGYAYCWLFGFDFVLRGAYTTSITAHLPPDLIHLSGVPLHMYLGGYALPAFSYSLAGKRVSLHFVLIVAQLLLNLNFGGCLFAFWRIFAKSPSALMKTGAAALIAYSYYWTFALARHAATANELPLSMTRFLIPFLRTGDVSHLFQRMFLVEPQAITALSVLLVVMTIALAEADLLSVPVSCILGALIGIELGIDSWLALNLAVWFALARLILSFRSLRKWPFWRNSAITVAICTCIWASFFVVKMVSFGSASMVSIGWHWDRIRLGLLQYPVEYGPILLLGAWGLWSWLQTERAVPILLCALTAVIFLEDLFIRIGDLPQFRTGNRLLPIVLLIAIAWSFDQLRLQGRFRRAVSVCLLLFATPTLFTDIYGTSAISDKSRTYYVRASDREACDWIRKNIPQDAVIQSEPNYAGQPDGRSRGFDMSLIPDFAERRSVLGEEYAAESVCPDCKRITRARKAALQQMFDARAGSEISSLASQYKINYLYVGSYELLTHPVLLSVLQSSPELFDEIYARDGVHIFKIVANAEKVVTSSVS